MVKVPAPRSRQKCPQSAVALATVSWCANAGGIATEVNPSIIPKTAKCFIRWFFSFSLLLLATVVQTSENTSELSRLTELGTSSIGGEKYREQSDFPDEVAVWVLASCPIEYLA